MGHSTDTQNALQAEWSLLVHQWQVTASQWKDAARQRFEREFWQEYEQIVPIYSEELKSLSLVLDKARQTLK
jgi:hypothetical protein